MPMQYEKGKPKMMRTAGRVAALLSVCLLVSFAFCSVNIKRSTQTFHNLNTNQNDPSISAVKRSNVYVPAQTEQFLMDNMINLGWDVADNETRGCDVWTNQKEGISNQLESFRSDLNEYFTPAIHSFQPVKDLMDTIRQGKRNQSEICETVRPHPDGLEALFPRSQLSKGRNGFMEPLLTPMRHPDFCFARSRENLFTLDYIVHDFEAACRMLKPTSKLVFLDIGSTLNWGGITPVITLLDIYSKFGFEFDHVYSFEITFTDPNKFFNDLLPEKYLSSFHWINVGVDNSVDSKLNPLYSILTKFHEDDFIVVKLDVDNANIEVPLAKQLLEDERFHKLVDHFYFEQHVIIQEMPLWGGHMDGSIKDSFDLFQGIRKKGIAAHFWV